jgi:hypothetical protein
LFANDPDSKDPVTAKYDDMYVMLREWMSRVCQQLRQLASNSGLLECASPISASFLADFVKYFIWVDKQDNPDHDWIVVRSSAGQQEVLIKQESANRPIQGVQRLPTSVLECDTPSSLVRHLFDSFPHNALSSLEDCVMVFERACKPWFKSLRTPRPGESQHQANIRALLLVDRFHCIDSWQGKSILFHSLFTMSLDHAIISIEFDN